MNKLYGRQVWKESGLFCGFSIATRSSFRESLHLDLEKSYREIK